MALVLRSLPRAGCCARVVPRGLMGPWKPALWLLSGPKLPMRRHTQKLSDTARPHGWVRDRTRTQQPDSKAWASYDTLGSLPSGSQREDRMGEGPRWGSESVPAETEGYRAAHPVPPTPQLSGCAPPPSHGCLLDSGAGALLDILADLPFQALPPLLQLLNGALLGELVRGTAELALSQGAAEQLLVGGKEGSVCQALPYRVSGWGEGSRSWRYLGKARDQGTAKRGVRGG